MSLLLAARKPAAGESVDTFQMARRQTFWPQLNTAESGTWGWAASGSKLFGGAYENSSKASGDYVEFANLPLFAANAKIKFLYSKLSDGGIIKIYWNGDQLGTLDTYNGSTTHNNIATVDLGTVTAGRGTLRLISDTKNASSSGYKISVQQVEVVQLTGDAAGTSLDDLPFVVDCPPSSYSDTTAAGTITQDTSTMWGTYIRTAQSLDQYTEYKVWIPQGTYDLDMIFYRGTNRAIATVSINGSDVGTIDQYGSSARNVTGTISSISIAATGVHTVRMTAASKHASSTGYFLLPQWMQFRKTTTTGAIAGTGATYGRETMELWPWFEEGSMAGWIFDVGSSFLHYGNIKDAGIGITLNLEHSLNPGTYSGLTVAREGTSRALVTITENGGAALDSMDWYNPSNVLIATRTFEVPSFHRPASASASKNSRCRCLRAPEKYAKRPTSCVAAPTRRPFSFGTTRYGFWRLF